MRVIVVILLLVEFVIGQLPTYIRSEWGNWIDENKDGENTRIEVLNAERIVTDGTYVWNCVYTNNTYTDVKFLDIDHTVPIYEAFVSGGYLWSKEKKKKYFNDLNNPSHLTAVYLGANRSKGSSDPVSWMPKYNRCQYLFNWIYVKQLWELTMDTVERDFIYNFLNDSCNCK